MAVDGKLLAQRVLKGAAVPLTAIGTRKVYHKAHVRKLIVAEVVVILLHTRQ